MLCTETLILFLCIFQHPKDLKGREEEQGDDRDPLPQVGGLEGVGGVKSTLGDLLSLTERLSRHDTGGCMQRWVWKAENHD